MKKICFVTAARSEYGLLKWLMKDVDSCEEFELQLIVTGGHLSYEQGHTIDQIIDDGFDITYIVDVELNTSTAAEIADSMGKMGSGFAKALSELKPDYLLVLGDRYELLPICNTAFVMRIPIIHISGGDITEGAIDDGIRNAVTMLADYHFPGTEDSAANVVRMRNNSKNVWSVGEPGLDAFYREKLISREKLADSLDLDVSKKWGLMTYHAETRESLDYNLKNVEMCVEALLAKNDLQTVITYANADCQGKQINEYIEKIAAEHPTSFIVIPSLGQLRYLSLMRQSEFVIGNSSSGIVEAPMLHIPVINIGNRQKGRYQCGNIIQCNSEEKDIKDAIEEISKINDRKIVDASYWGDGHTSERIMVVLKEVLR